MLPYRKEPLTSTPVPRIASSQRLNRLSPATIGSPAPNGAQFSSRPSTPIPYVPSSLNPNPARGTSAVASAVINTNTNVYDSKFEALPIVTKLREFELALSTLTSDITSYRDNDNRIQKTVDELIALNDFIYSDILDIETHQRLGVEIKTLKEENAKLDTLAKDSLKELIQYRNELKKLPKLPTVTSGTKTGAKDSLVDIKEILKYAMKLSKFTKIPPSAAEFPQQVHPNNYIWPAEDSLRRGMLAISSLRGDELIQAELRGDSVKEETVEDQGKEQAPAPSMPASIPASPALAPVPEPAPSKNSSSAASAPAPAPAPSLDLDLFDEDDLSD